MSHPRNSTPRKILYLAPDETGPWESLGGKRVLVIADALSLARDAEPFGYSLRFDALASLIRARCDASLHLVLTLDAPFAEIGQDRARRMGWNPHLQPRRIVPLDHGSVRFTHDSAFTIGLAAGLWKRGNFDALVLGLADAGSLLAMREILHDLKQDLLIHSLSLIGNSADRLAGSSAGHMLNRIVLGLDSLDSTADEQDRPFIHARD